MKKRGWIILIVLMLILLPSAFSLGLTGKKLSPIIYEPDKVIINHYKIDGANSEVEVTVGGDLQEYITLSEVTGDEFDLMIHFPDEFIEPGTYSFGLSVKEVTDSLSPGVSSLIAVSKSFIVEVYSHEKALEISLGASDVNENGTVPFVVNLRSRTYSDIDSVKAGITIYNSENNSVGKVNTNEGPLPALQVGELKASFDSIGLTAGDYSALALVNFDGIQEVAETKFKIGALDLILKNYTHVLEQGFSEFVVKVGNNWGNGIQNVYAKLLINDIELLQTPSINLNPWQEGELKGIVKIELEPGKYDGLLQLFYEGEFKEENVKITIIKSNKGSLGVALYLIIGGVVIIVILMIVLSILLVRKKKKSKIVNNNQKSEEKETFKKQKKEVDEI